MGSVGDVDVWGSQVRCFPRPCLASMARFADVWAIAGREMKLVRRTARVAVGLLRRERERKMQDNEKTKRQNWGALGPGRGQTADAWRGRDFSRFGEGGCGERRELVEAGMVGAGRREGRGEGVEEESAWEGRYK